MGRSLISYGVDVYRVKRLLKRDALGLLEDMLEDDRAWFARCDKRHRALIEQGAPASREAMRHILCDEPRQALGGAIYVDAALLLCEYVGQRLSSDPYRAGIPWDEQVMKDLARWIGSYEDSPEWFAPDMLMCESIGLTRVLRQMKEPGAGWLEPEHCEQLDQFFSALHDLDGQDVRWEDDEVTRGVELDEELRGVVQCLEAWVLTCRERGWAMATFSGDRAPP